MKTLPQRPRCPACYGSGSLMDYDIFTVCGTCDGEGFDPIMPALAWELRIWNEHEQRWDHPDARAGSDAHLFPSWEAAIQARDSLRRLGDDWRLAAYDIRAVPQC